MKFVFVLFFIPLFTAAQDTVFIRNEPCTLSPVVFKVGDSAYQTILPRSGDNDSVVFLLPRSLPSYRNKDVIETYYGSTYVAPLKFNVIIHSDTLPVSHSMAGSRPYVVDHDSTKRFKGFGPGITSSDINDFFRKRVQASVNGKPVTITRIGVIFFDLFNRKFPCTLWPPTPPCRLTQLSWKPEYLEIRNAFIIVDGRQVEIANINIACKII